MFLIYSEEGDENGMCSYGSFVQTQVCLNNFKKMYLSRKLERDTSMNAARLCTVTLGVWLSNISLLHCNMSCFHVIFV